MKILKRNAYMQLSLSDIKLYEIEVTPRHHYKAIC